MSAMSMTKQGIIGLIFKLKIRNIHIKERKAVPVALQLHQANSPASEAGWPTLIELGENAPFSVGACYNIAMICVIEEILGMNEEGSDRFSHHKQ